LNLIKIQFISLAGQLPAWTAVTCLSLIYHISEVHTCALWQHVCTCTNRTALPSEHCYNCKLSQTDNLKKYHYSKVFEFIQQKCALYVGKSNQSWLSYNWKYWMWLLKYTVY